MKSLRTVRYSLIAAAVAGAAVVSTPASAEVSATASVANIYLWRGQNLGSGTPVVAGSLDYTHESGLFAGIWTSSAGPASEVDLYGGFSGKAGDFSYTAAYYYYAYPTALAPSADADVKELYFSGSIAGFKAEVLAGIGDSPWGDNGEMYYTLSYNMDKYTAKLGIYETDSGNPGSAVGSYNHLDLAYAYNDNLSFTVSKILDVDVGAKGDPLLAVSYAIPLK